MNLSDAKAYVVSRGRVLYRRLGGEQPRQPKVFAIGFNKSGTTSMHTLFASLGLLSYHGPAWRTCTNQRLLDTYDCFSDDIPHDLEALDRTYPGARFILQVRELDTWILSRLWHIDRRQTASSRYRVHREWDVSEEAVTAWVRQREDYHRFVIDYFADRPQDLQIVNFVRDADAASRIAVYLGYEPVNERPLKNISGREPDPAHFDLMASVLDTLGIPQSDWRHDLMSPTLAATDCRPYPTDTQQLVRTQQVPGCPGHYPPCS